MVPRIVYNEAIRTRQLWIDDFNNALWEERVMRRTFVTATVAAAIVAALAIALWPGVVAQSPTQHADNGNPVLRPPAAQLPISQVVLFSSGVGYFQREGEIEGSTRIDLTFPVEDINDLIKSLVLQDLGGGHVSAVSYDSRDPVEKTLRSFALDLTQNPSFGQLLRQARGEKVEAIMQPSNVTQPGTLTGAIVGVETQRQPAGKDGTVEVELLNLLCADGVRCVPLNQVQRVRFLNPVIDGELKRALEVLAQSHDTQKKSVSLNFTGEGKRPVRVGYVVDNPIWKTSYRLVLDKEGKPFLQGWAVVENTSDEDWSNVRMALVSGRPISFQMDLYQPLYVPRPMVEPELFASLRPQAYGGAMEKDKALAANGPAEAPAVDASAGFGLAAPRGGAMKKEAAATLGDIEAGGNLTRAMRRTAGAQAVSAGEALGKAVRLDRGVASAASATDMGNFFEYLIKQPVSIARQKSALLPIVNQEVEGTKVSIYNQGVHAKFPLHGLRLKNTTPLHLMQGPITVFEGSSYAGDARIMDLQPKEERLLSYAVDLGTEVEPVAKHDPDRLTAVKIVKGIMHVTHKLRQSRTYNVKNRSSHDRTVLVEHPFRADWKLTTPEKAGERTREVYRFDLNVAAGKSASQEVVEEQDRINQMILSNTDDQSIRFFMNSTVTSAKVREALSKAVDLKGKLSGTQRQIAELDRQLKAITDDQTRLRANLEKVPPTSAAYKRYLEKFDNQETEIEKLQAQTKDLRKSEEQQRKDYEGYLVSLNVE